MTTDPVSPISNPIVGDAASQSGLSPLLAQANPRPPQPDSAPAPAAPNSSPLEGLAGRITAAHRDFPQVNTPLIEAIRAMIAQGRAQPNTDAIAQKLLQFDQLLPGEKP